MDERILGQSKAVYSVRSTDQSILKVCQDGGAVSSLLKHMLETQSVNCAVVTQTDMNEPLRPVPRIAAETTAVIAGAGTKYSCGAAVAAIAEAALGYPNGRIAFVGLPCEVQGLRRMGSCNRRIMWNLGT